jgi:probable F420-dependent oxidoreductase
MTGSEPARSGSARLCVGLNHLVPKILPSLGELPGFCTDLERWGAAQVVLGEHLMLQSGMAHLSGDAFPWPANEPFPEPLTMLAAIASVTSTIRLSTGILIAPLRPAILLAKTAATVDDLSGGRLDLGLGAGWWEPEFEAADVDLADRMERVDEIMAVCRALWSGTDVSFKGRWSAFHHVRAAPVPAAGAAMQVWYGAKMTRSTARRVAQTFDGWIGRARLTPDEVAASVDRLVSACEEEGRDPSELAVRVTLPWFDTWGEAAAMSADAAIAAAVEAGYQHIDGGATHLVVPLDGYARDRDEAEHVVRSLVSAFH